MILMTAAPARAADKPPAEDGFKFTKYYIDETIGDNATEDGTFTFAMQVLREDAVDALKEYSITYSTSAEKVDVVEAYTQKPDGKRIDAPKDNFQLTVSGGRAGANPAFSDETTMTIVFPQVEVGDTLNVTYKRKVTDPLFPKQFSHLLTFPKEIVYEDARISYSIPLSLNAKYHNYGLVETVNKQENGRQLLTWTYKNMASQKSVGHTVTVVDHIGDDPGVALSTFPSYKEVAESYGARATPKAAVTDEIRKLADSLVEGKGAERDKVKAIYDWEIKNISYAGNCIGIGSVVPRDLPFVLTNKMGDCKDHATLFQALLAAENIKSSQALIGANLIYDLPELPIVEIANHVINYVPDLDLYLDTTSRLPFGVLSSQLAGKPVLLVDGYKDGTRTPVMPAATHRRTTAGKATIADDGSIEGDITISLSGIAAYKAHETMKDYTQAQVDRLDERMLNSSGYEGSVEMKPGKWDEDMLSFSYDIHFKLKDFVYPGTPGALVSAPPFSPQSVATAVAEAIGEKAKQQKDKLTKDFVCGSGIIEENYVFELPANMNILAVPDDVTAKSDVQTYTAKYTHEGQKVTVTRTLDDTTPGPTCTPLIEQEYEKVASKAWRDMKAQIVYK